LRRRHPRRLRLPVHITEVLLVVEDSLEDTMGTMWTPINRRQCSAERLR
jgi:hypothetical protein